MAAERSARRERELPGHEEPGENKDTGGEGSISFDVAELDKQEKEHERKTRTGGDERRDDAGAEDQGGALDALVEDSSEEVRLRRREERRARKDERVRRERELETRLETTERELAAVRAREVQGQQVGLRRDYEAIEGEMGRLQVSYRDALAAKEKAFKDGDAKTAVEADEVINAAKDRFRVLSSQRAQIVEVARRQQEGGGAPQVSQQLRQHADSFMKDYPWLDMKGGDKDSARVVAIDKRMAAEGWDPNTKGYWEELRDRVEEDEKLAHRFEEDDRGRGAEREEEERPARQRQRTGGSDRDIGAGRGGNRFVLSKARVDALKEAGMYDLDDSGRPGPKLLKMIKVYKARDERERNDKRSSR